MSCIYLIFCFFNFYNLKIFKKIKLPIQGVEKALYDYNGFVILNREKSIILRIDTTGNILDTIIKGKGEDVKEAKWLAGIFIDKKSGNIFISDIMLKRVSEFNKKGNFINSFLLPYLLVGDIWVCGDTIYVRTLNKYEEIDSLHYVADIIYKVDRENGEISENVIRAIVNRKIDEFFSMPFYVDCENKLIYIILPPNEIQVRTLNGELLNKIIEHKWIFLTDLFLLDKYIIISSFSEDKRGYIPFEMIKYWRGISLNEYITKEIIKRKLFKVRKESPAVFEEVSYVLDIFDIEKNRFVLKNYLPPGKLVDAKDDELFFISNDTLLVMKLTQ